MYVYTVKVKIEPTIKNNILKFYTQKHLPDVIATGCFSTYTIEYDHTQNEVIVRYPCDNQTIFDNYIANHAERLRKDTYKNFPTGILKVERNFCEIINKH